MGIRPFRAFLLSLPLAALPAAAGAAHYAVCVGVNQYGYIPSDNWLRGCVADAGNLWTNLVERGEWTPEGATLLLDAAATKAAVRAAITNAAAAAAAGDVFVYTHSSHGYSYQNAAGQFTLDTGLCTYDGDYDDFELAADLAKFPSGAKVVVFVDACHSGGLFKAKRGTRALAEAESDGSVAVAPFDLAGRVGAAIDAIRAKETLVRGAKAKGISSAEIGWVTAADYDQSSFDGASGGAFTSAALHGWNNGYCDGIPYGDEDGYADFYELWNYAKDFATGLAESGEDHTDAQCANTNVLLSVRAGWAGTEPPPGPDDPPRFNPLGDGEFDVGQTAETHVCVYAPAEAPVTNLYIAVGDPSATLSDGWFSFTPAAVDDYQFTLVAENANGAASNSFTIVVYPAEPEPPVFEDVTANSFNAVWNPSPGAEGYVLSVFKYNRFRWQSVLSRDAGDATNCVVSGLSPNVEYRVCVSAYASACGETRYSFASPYVYVTTDRLHVAPSWSAVPRRTAQVGRVFVLDLASFVNGYPAPVFTLAAGEAAIDGTTLRFTPAAEGTDVFTVVASNDAGSASATFEVAVEAFAPKKFALCVGINEYKQLSGLGGCVNDAKFLSANLIDRGGWDDGDVTVLLDSAATKAAIRGAVANVAAQAAAGDTFVYMQSSHGGQLGGGDGKAVYLCVYDEDDDDDSTAYNDWEIASDLAAFPAGVKVVAIVDACNSGGLFKSREAARAAAPSVDLAARVSEHLEGERARRRGRGQNVARTLSADEIGWAVACEYDELSREGGFFHTDAWLTDSLYGEEYWDSRWQVYRYPVSYRMGGVFAASATWGWWSGRADADAEAGDGDGLCDAYEFWKQGRDFCADLGEFWWGNSDYDYYPQCTNVAVLRSVELGWSVPPDALPALPAGATADDVFVRLAGAADAALAENVATPAAYEAYRAWAQTVKDPAGTAPAGAAAVHGSPRSWLSFALGADALLGRDLTPDDVSIASFAPAATAGRYELELDVGPVEIGAGGVDQSLLLPNLAKVLGVEGAATPDPDAFSPGNVGLSFRTPADGNARLVVAPPDGADAYFFRATVSQ